MQIWLELVFILQKYFFFTEKKQWHYLHVCTLVSCELFNPCIVMKVDDTDYIPIWTLFIFYVAKVKHHMLWYLKIHWRVMWKNIYGNWSPHSKLPFCLLGCVCSIESLSVKLIPWIGKNAGKHYFSLQDWWCSEQINWS